jgi:hypothetical protein
MDQPDPTDYALATIASILEGSEPRREADRVPAKKAAEASTEKAATETVLPESASTANASTDKPSTEASPPPLPPEANGYSKVSPGPIAAIRVRWTVRRADNGDYFVDEMVGEQSERMTSGPMAKDAAVKLVDDREAEARQRFEQLRDEMTRGGEASRP